jgi:hypothetical protein
VTDLDTSPFLMNLRRLTINQFQCAVHARIKHLLEIRASKYKLAYSLLYDVDENSHSDLELSVKKPVFWVIVALSLLWKRKELI